MCAKVPKATNRQNNNSADESMTGKKHQKPSLLSKSHPQRIGNDTRSAYPPTYTLVKIFC